VGLCLSSDPSLQVTFTWLISDSSQWIPGECGGRVHTHTHTHARARARTHTQISSKPWLTVCSLQFRLYDLCLINNSAANYPIKTKPFFHHNNYVMRSLRFILISQYSMWYHKTSCTDNAIRSRVSYCTRHVDTTVLGQRTLRKHDVCKT
jgi:hypothetical protein